MAAPAENGSCHSTHYLGCIVRRRHERYSYAMRLSPALLIALVFAHPSFAAETTLIAEGHYVMADGDTLAIAEERVLQRAQRRAVEEAGVYLESAFYDVEKSAGSENLHTASLEIRTIAAAITKTEVLESRRSFDADRPNFYVKIRVVVNLDYLQDAIRRFQSERQFAAHFRQLQKENAELKAQLQELQSRPAGTRTLTVEAGRTGARVRAQTLVANAVASHDLRQKLEWTSQAAVLDPESADPLIVRGQSYLQLVSVAYSSRSKLSEYSAYIDKARMDFDRALMIDPKNTWALLGQGDVQTWLNRPEEAASSYEQALRLNPLFDIARQRMIALQTTQARKLAAAKQWSAALALLNKLLHPPLADSWLPYEKEAFLLRSDVYQQLNQPLQAIQDLSVVLEIDPTHAAALLARAKLYREHLQGRSAKDDFEHACMLGSSEACEQLP